MHRIAVAVWIMNVILALVSWFYPMPIWINVLLILWTFAAFIAIVAQKCPLGDLLNCAPVLLRRLGLFSAGYTLVNFLSCMYLLREGGPRSHDGVYCLWDHGFIREITRMEYDALMLVENRFWFGHSLLFTGLMMAALYGAHLRRQNQT